MLFSSILFLFVFLPTTLLIYYLVKGVFWRNFVLLCASLLFYAWGEFEYTAVLLITIFLSWGFALLIESSPQRHAKKYLAFGIVVLFGLLIYYKYSFFLCENLDLLGKFLHIGGGCAPLHKHLPIGISFFVFQAVSYLIDVYRRDVAAQKSLFKVAVYKSFFPQLIAGPIVRYVDVAKSISERKESISEFSEGARRFVIGLAQKVLLANTVGSISEIAFGLKQDELSTSFAWIGAFCYFFQIYYDFSGYSNMAIGLGRMFGFRFLENFNHPYSANSITDFWRRWHISLSSWFRDYLYIPLGGNRISNFRTYLNLYIVFFLCGLWHGSSWNFILWGLLHGTLLVFERTRAGSAIHHLPRFLQAGYTWFFVIIGWVLFRTNDLMHAKIYFKAMFSKAHPSVMLYKPLAELMSPEVWMALLFCVLLSFPNETYTKYLRRLVGLKTLQPVFSHISFACLLLLSLAYLAAASFNPFIYFRF